MNEKRKQGNKSKFSTYFGRFLLLLIALPFLFLFYVICNLGFIIVNSINQDQANARLIEPIVQELCSLPDYRADWQKFHISDEGLGRVYTDRLDDESGMVYCYRSAGNWQCSCLEPQSSLEAIEFTVQQICGLPEYEVNSEFLNQGFYYQDFIAEEELNIRCYYSAESWICNCWTRD